MLQYFFLLWMGGLMYGTIELLFRGYTHWTMLLTGGICFCVIYAIETHLQIPIWWKAAVSCAFITTAELAVGVVVNRILHLNVWDYSEIAMNFMGQICLRFSVIWYLISFPALLICRHLHTTFLFR